MNHIVECDNILVLELFHQRDFSDGSGRGTLLGVEVDLLESDEFACLAVAAFEYLVVGERISDVLRSARTSLDMTTTHRGICSLSKLLQLLERAGVSFPIHDV